MAHLLAIGWPGPMEMIIIAALGLLFFGKRLPEVGRSIGKTIVEFKKGMKEVEQEIYDNESTPPAAPQPRKAIGQVARFDPYTGKPLYPGAEQEAPEQQPATTGSAAPDDAEHKG